ncbi:MAG: hypothetical protein DRJ61_04595 [Acidobacteria bacterium]|nr:MAG: hypothetical protein DRJ61_04595 [Acidobacteriota bacterium]
MLFIGILFVIFSVRAMMVFKEYRVLEYSNLTPEDDLSEDEFRRLKLMIVDRSPEICFRKICAKVNYGNVLNQDYIIPSNKYRFKALVLIPYFRYCISEKQGFSLVVARTDYFRFKRKFFSDDTCLDDEGKAGVLLAVFDEFR